MIGVYVAADDLPARRAASAALHRRQLVQRARHAVSSGRVLLWPVDFTLRGYRRRCGDPQILTGFANSLFYTVVGTLISVDAHRGDRLPALAHRLVRAGR